MKFEFSELELPEIPNRLDGSLFERFKKTLVAKLLSQRLDVFNSQKSNDGPWQPLGESQAARRIEKVSPKKRNKPGAVMILQDTRMLLQSFTDASGVGNALRQSSTEGDQVSIASVAPYARIQNEGGTFTHPGTPNGFGKGILIPAHEMTIPARPFDQFTAENLTEINELTELFINGEL
jgi:phage gpG-like protein